MAAPGDFSFIKSKTERDMLEDAYNAVTVSNSWDFFRTQAPPDDTGYMFWNTHELMAITKNMKYRDLHSGASFAGTMRAMQSISLIGWDSWVAGQMRPSNTISFAEAQVKVIQSIKDEPIDNGMHFQWIMRKEKFAREMTQESMAETLLGSTPVGLTDATIKYTVAKQIHGIMTAE